MECLHCVRKVILREYILLELPCWHWVPGIQASEYWLMLRGKNATRTSTVEKVAGTAVPLYKEEWGVGFRLCSSPWWVRTERNWENYHWPLLLSEVGNLFMENELSLWCYIPWAQLHSIWNLMNLILHSCGFCVGFTSFVFIVGESHRAGWAALPLWRWWIWTSSGPRDMFPPILLNLV